MKRYWLIIVFLSLVLLMFVKFIGAFEMDSGMDMTMGMGMGTERPEGDGLYLESSGYLLLETGDYFLLE